jgi:site-specific DNA-methyltransferase (adenine-specific)
MIKIKNMDCMLAIKSMEDNEFDLAIVDPPYGIGAAKQIDLGNSNIKQKHKTKDWDNKIPPIEYYVELQRVSKNQIIWGGNYFLDYLGATRCFLVWDKQNGNNNLADCELAWTSFNTSVRMYRGHIFKGIGNTNYNPIHPTQKPVRLYQWILSKYAKKGDKILDTHLGSGSIAIACHDLGIDLEGYELDKEYYQGALARLKNHQKQLSLFQ